MTYVIKLKKSAQKELQKLDRKVAERILVRIYMLADDPRPAASTPLVGRPGFRLRVGDYRILYNIEREIVTVLVTQVGHRSSIYEEK